MTKLSEENVGLLIVDIQGTLAHRVHNSQSLIHNVVKLVQCCKLLGVPIVVLEQNPDGLGETIPEIEMHVASAPHFKKFTFNAVAGTDQYSSDILSSLSEMALTRWLIVGIEAHVCVYQTAIGLLENNVNVEVVGDCISSRESSNAVLAINNMREHGAQISSVEMAVFGLLKTCQHPKFQEVLTLIKQT